MTSARPVSPQRCAVHPSRPAADRCPVCGRGRCGADAARFAAAGCPACAGRPRPEPARPGEAVVRAALAALVTAYVGAWIAAQYVDTQYFSVLAPGLVGLACAWAASAATPQRYARLAVLVGGLAGVVGTGLSDRLVPGGQNLLLPVGHRLPPYVAAVVGAFAWPILFGQPPRGTRRK